MCLHLLNLSSNNIKTYNMNILINECDKKRLGIKPWQDLIYETRYWLPKPGFNFYSVISMCGIMCILFIIFILKVILK